MAFTFTILSCFVIGYASAHTQWNLQPTMDALNLLRRNHCSPNVTLSTTVSKAAQAWADTMARHDLWRHSSSPYGENLAANNANSRREFNSTDWNKYLASAMRQWYGEVTLYNFRNPVYSSATGHFTQLVWYKMTEVGIGVAYSDASRRVYIVMHYNPPGNYKGQFDINVFPTERCSPPARSPPARSPPPSPVRKIRPPPPPPPPPYSPPPRPQPRSKPRPKPRPSPAKKQG
jgi:glioma pathogenesis-related protein 2